MRTRNQFALTLSLAGIVFGSGALIPSTQSFAQDGVAGFYTDPATGIVYRQVARTIQRPVVETKITQRQQTVYSPQTVVENRPTTVRTYTPVTEYRWEPRMEGRWNPFRQPTVAYHHVPSTHWEPRDQVITQSSTRVEWKAENRTVDVPERTLSMKQEQSISYEPVGHVGTQTAIASAPTPSSNLRPEVAARLRPLPAGAQVGNFTSPPMSNYAASGPTRNRLQTGIRATELSPYPTSTFGPTGVLGPSAGPATGVAGLPAMTIWR